MHPDSESQRGLTPALPLDQMKLAGYVVLGLVAYEQAVVLRGLDLAVGLTLVGFLLAFGMFDRLPRHLRPFTLALQLALAGGNAFAIESSAGPILGVLVAAQLPFVCGLRAAASVVSFSVAMYAVIFGITDVSRPLFRAGLYGGFQCFALLTAHLAATARHQRDQLSLAHGDLLATRHLLEAGARDSERLRLSRELHDVAGYRLTALKLNLELALRLQEQERGPRIGLARDLVDALLEDLHGVVGQLRRHDGVDLEPALLALAGSFPGLDVRVEVQPGLRVDNVSRAEVLVRCAQEALTNVARHAHARSVRLCVTGDNREVQLDVHDDGSGCAELVPGYGLTGMRERLEDHDGRLEVQSALGRGTRVLATLPSALR